MYQYIVFLGIITQAIAQNIPPIYPNSSTIVLQFFQAGDEYCETAIITQGVLPNNSSACTPVPGGWMSAGCDSLNDWSYGLWNSEEDCKNQNGQSWQSQSGNMGNCSYDGSDPPLFQSVLGFCGQSSPLSPKIMQKKVDSNLDTMGLILFMDSNCKYAMNDPFHTVQVQNPFKQSGTPFYNENCFVYPFDGQSSTWFSANCTSGLEGGTIYFWEDSTCHTVNEFGASAYVVPNNCYPLDVLFFNDFPSEFWFQVYCPTKRN